MYIELITYSILSVMENVKSFRELLSRRFETVDCDITTGKRVNTTHTSRGSFLADFEVEALIEALRKTVANKPQS